MSLEIGGSQAINLKLTEDYLDTMEEIMKNAKILMLPEERENESMLSTNNIARIISTY